jgi:putative transposase
MKKTATPRTLLAAGIARVLDLEERMVKHAIGVDHSTVHRWVLKLVPLFEKTFRRRKRPTGRSWRMDETHIKVKGQ